MGHAAINLFIKKNYLSYIVYVNKLHVLWSTLSWSIGGIPVFIVENHKLN
jgi:hypothetical protein